jgi:hypothetical protein
MSDSYVLTPSNPTINNDGSFNLVYNTTSVPLGDIGDYNLVNLNTNNTIMKSIIGSSFEMIQKGFQYSGNNFSPNAIIGLPNGNMWIDAQNTSPLYPYSMVYDTSGTKILENSDISFTECITMDSSYLYGFSPNCMSKYTLEGAYIPGAGITLTNTYYSAVYCAVDGYIYAVNQEGNIHKIDKTTGAFTVFKIISRSLLGLSFNYDYSYLYYINTFDSYIYYIQRTNSANTATLTYTDNSPVRPPSSGTATPTSRTLTMNREANILYTVSTQSGSPLYVFKLLSPTVTSNLLIMTSLGASVNTIDYNNETKKLYTVTRTTQKLVIFSSTTTSLSYLNVPRSSLFNGDNTLRIQSNGTNFGNAITFNATRPTDSYEITPLNPNNTQASETFDVVYTTQSFQLADDASYALVNTTTGSVIKTIRPTVSSFNTIAGTFGGTAHVIYEIGNNQIFVAFGVPPYFSIYNENGTLAYNASPYDTVPIYGISSNGTFLYTNLTYGYHRHDLSGNLILGSGIDTQTWTYGSDYNPNDNCIYSALNSGGIYKFNLTTNTGSTWVGIGPSSANVFGGVAFNSDYSYLYCTNRLGTTRPEAYGNIHYFQTSNVNNTGILAGLKTDLYAISCDRSTNTLYISSPNNNTPYVYSCKLLTATTATAVTRAHTLGTSSWALYYSNTQKRLLVLDKNRKIYIFKDSTLSFLTIPASTALNGGANILQIKRNGINFGNPMTVNATCFLEGTRILCLTDTFEEQYVKIENMKKGMLVKTHLHGFKPVHSIGKGKIYNPTKETTTTDRLYMISKKKCSDLIDDLYITGNHSVLVPSLTDEQHEKITDYMKEIYITDDQYRLPACLDERFTECGDYGNKTIWHFALEHDDIFENYGVYANGLLVETCSIRYLTELSTLELQE